jgi:hypothetical protein
MYDTVDYPQPTRDYLPDKCRGSHEADAVFVLRITRTVHHGFGLLLSSSTLATCSRGGSRLVLWTMTAAWLRQ